MRSPITDCSRGSNVMVVRQVIVAEELPAVDITADQIAFVCAQLGSLAGHLDDVLHGRFGGASTFEVPPARLN